MPEVRSSLPDQTTDKPPVVLVHGAANSAAVWTLWQRELAERGWPSYALELRGHGTSDPIDLSSTTMGDYAGDVRSVIGDLARTPVVMGWSMGGLVALMVAASDDARACVALAPSLPSRTRDASAPMRPGTFGGDFYGITSDDPDDQDATMPDLERDGRVIALSSLSSESQLARDDRKAGIVIESTACPLLIVAGTADRIWPPSKYDGLWLPAERVDVEGASHWGLVLSRRALSTLAPRVVGWMEGSAP
jgi:pimeloyl-ACP methyl ester carboxylesterase